MDRERAAREERKHSSSPPATGNNAERKKAIAELEKEKETTYNDLKAAIGKEEAD